LLQDVVALVKTQSCVPIVLFPNANVSFENAGVDLVVDCLTPPEVWLNDVEGLIEKTRPTLRA
jgi:hypothetical protein